MLMVEHLISYILENAYPYSIDAVPLSYGSSQITRVNVNLYYSRHTVVYGDGKNKDDDAFSIMTLRNTNFPLGDSW